MHGNEYTDELTGNLKTKTIKEYNTKIKYFVPNKLPPKDVNDEDFHRNIKKLDKKFNQLNNFIQKSNIDIDFRNIEPIFSSKIENINVKLIDLIRYQEDRKFQDKNTIKVNNYYEALNKGIQHINDDKPIDINLILKLHNILMKDEKHSGEFRDIQNYVGVRGSIKHAKYIPPDPSYIEDLMKNCCNYLYSNDIKTYPIVKSIIFHYQFESIHPFVDGNGRLGRLLMLLYLYDKNVIKYCSKYPLSMYIYKNIHDYYNLLEDVSKKGSWKQWINYMINNMINTIDYVIDTYKCINSLIDEYLTMYNKNNYDKFIKKMPMKIGFSIKSMSNELDISYQKSRRIINKLEKDNIIQEITGKNRYKYYKCNELIYCYNY